MISIYLSSPEETAAVGRVLGSHAEPGLVVAANGNLGAGKTTLAQGMARGLDVPTDHYVNSPTFAILQSHPGRFPFHHIDLYRLGDLDEAYGIGLEEVIGHTGVAFIEWAGQIPELLPADYLCLNLAIEGPGRRLQISGMGPLAKAFLVKCALSNAS